MIRCPVRSGVRRTGEAGADSLPAVAESAHRLLAAIATAYQALAAARRIAGRAQPVRCRYRAQRDALVHPGFFVEMPWDKLQHLPRYLTALDRRIVKYLDHPERTRAMPRRWRRCGSAIGGPTATGCRSPGAGTGRLPVLLEELKVSLFAQELKTPFPASYKRVERPGPTSTARAANGAPIAACYSRPADP